MVKASVLPPRFQSVVADGQKVCMGVRPDDVFPDGHGLDTPHPETRDVVVTMTEPLGNETRVSFDFGGQNCTARMLRPRPMHAGEKVRMTVDLAHIHLFDGDTGATLAGDS